MKKIKEYLKLMRVHHYIKNFLVLLALICSGQFFDLAKLKNGLLGFISFCAVSSVVYIFNDIMDKDKDKLHPKKCKRPIASESIAVNKAIILAVGLIGSAVICSMEMTYIWPFLLLLVYLFINIAYSFGLKNIPIVDVSILVSGFLIRIIYGALVTDIHISNWLYLTVIAISFYFAFGKRRNELRQVGNGNTRKVLKHYQEGFLDKNMYMCLGLANVFYALWSVDSNTIESYGIENLIFTVPVVFVITMKYSFDIEGDSDGDPVEVIIHDKVLLFMCLLYIITMFIILYF